jgi:hypothetical protein
MYLDTVKARFRSLNVLRRQKVVPCTEKEVRRLEKTLGFPLPAAYREFLRWMGHGAGNFLRGTDCFYKCLPLLQGWATELLEENENPVVLPEDAFVFGMHQGYQFVFLRRSDGDNPPIYYYTEVTGSTRIVNGQEISVPGRQFVVSHPSLTAFLDDEISHYVEVQQLHREVQGSPWFVRVHRWLVQLFRQ